MKDYPPFEDQELLMLMQKGDQLAFREIYERYWEKLLATGFYYTRNKELAEEIVHDVLLSLWNKKEDLLIRSLSAYLGTAVKYAVFKAILRAKKRQEILKGEVNAERDDGTEERLDALFLSDFLKGVTERLPEKTRLIFKYSREDQFSVHEIAGKMDISPKVVEYHITKALKTLRESIRKFNLLSWIF